MDGFFRMDYELMREWAERALSTARPLGDRPLTAAAVAVLAFASATSGATPEAEAHRSEAAALVADLDDDELALRLDAAANLAGAELYLDRYEEAGAHAERALSVGRATGQSEFIPLPYSILGQVKLLRGQLAEAGELLDNAVEGARLSGNVQALAGNLVNRSLAALAAGDLGTGARHRRGERRADERARPEPRLRGRGGARRRAPRERRSRARRRCPSVVSSGGDELPLIPGVWRAKCARAAHPLLARARPPERSRTRGRERAGHGRGPSTPHGGFDGRSRRGGRRARGRRSDLAAKRALAAADAADEVGAPVEAGLARTLAGRALAQAGQTERAVAELKHAASELHACGALRYRAAAERELRGSAIASTAAPGPARSIGRCRSR